MSPTSDDLDGNEEDTETSPPPQRTAWERLQETFLIPLRSPRAGNSAGADVAITDAEKRRRITLLDPKERKWGYVGAGIAAVIALAASLPFLLKPNTAVSRTESPTGKTHACSDPRVFKYDKSTKKCNGSVIYPLHHWVWIFLLLLFFALAILITVRVGRRSAAGFAMLMGGFAYESQVGVLGLPFIAGGGWYLIRAWRVQRYGSPTGKRPAPDRTKPRERPPPSARPENRRRTRAGTDSKVTPTRSAPTASKRYTPKPQQKKKRPTPSS